MADAIPEPEEPESVFNKRLFVENSESLTDEEFKLCRYSPPVSPTPRGPQRVARGMKGGALAPMSCQHSPVSWHAGTPESFSNAPGGGGVLSNRSQAGDRQRRPR